MPSQDRLCLSPTRRSGRLIPHSFGESRMRRSTWFVALVLLPVLAAGVCGDLPEYLKKPEPKYAWKLKHNSTGFQGKTFEIELVSQEWHGITWTHTIEVYQPKDVPP